MKRQWPVCLTSIHLLCYCNDSNSLWHVALPPRTIIREACKEVKCPLGLAIKDAGGEKKKCPTGEIKRDRKLTQHCQLKLINDKNALFQTSGDMKIFLFIWRAKVQPKLASLSLFPDKVILVELIVPLPALRSSHCSLWPNSPCAMESTQSTLQLQLNKWLSCFLRVKLHNATHSQPASSSEEQRDVCGPLKSKETFVGF